VGGAGLGASVDDPLQMSGGFKSAKQQYAADLCKKGQHQQAAAMFNNQVRGCKLSRCS